MGEDYEILEGLYFDEDDDIDNPEKVLEVFDEFCIGETTEIFEIYRFFTKKNEKL